MADRPLSSRPRPSRQLSSYGLVKRLWQEYMFPYRGATYVACAALMVTALLNAAQAWLIAPAIDTGLIDGNTAALIWVAIAVVGVGLAKGLADFTQSALLASVGTSIVADLQARMMKSAIVADLGWVHRGGSGRLVARFLSDSTLVREATNKSLVGLVKDSLTIVGMMGVMLWQSWELTLSIIVIFPLSVLPIIWVGRRLRRLARQAQENIGDTTHLIDNFLKTLRIVKAYVAEPLANTQARQLFSRQARLQAKAIRTRAALTPVLETMAGVAVASLILVGSIRVSSGANTPGEIMSFLSAMLMAYQPMRSLASLNASLQQGLAAAERCFEVVDHRPEVTSPAIKSGRTSKSPLIASPLEAEAQDYSINLEHVTFRYDSDSSDHQTEKGTLQDLSLAIKHGETAALVGPSGAGKSTIINLILRLYDPESGQVQIGGRDAREFDLAHLRQQISLVAQEPGLLTDSVTANIALSDMGQSENGRGDAIDKDRVRQAAVAAEALEFIEALPHGFDTILDEMGSALSGGQKQRLAIARAIYKDAPILLLDEATSALDSETEQAVQKALQTLMAGRTALLVAHRLSTVRQADVIHIIDGGQLKESGTHTQLLETGGLYADFCRHQFQPAA